MIKLKIDNKEIEIEEGSPVILAAKKAGVEIPAMCWREDHEHITSCMVCLVKDAATGKLLPSCSVEVSNGQEIITLDDEIHEARKTALELLLSEHVGDCEAPCQITCPAHMDIPLMNRLLAMGEYEKAYETVKQDIALPAIFGRICPAPCEGACRRKSVDEALSICLLKRFTGDEYIGKSVPLKKGKIEKEINSGSENLKKIAVIGGGPAGLAAAYYLQLRAYQVDLFDRNDIPGGSMKREIVAGTLPEEILVREVSGVEAVGVKFILNTNIDTQRYEELKSEYDAVIIATGSGKSGVETWGLEMYEKGIVADKNTYRINNSAIFVAGSAFRPSKLAIRALGQGKEVAFSVDQFLKGEKVIGERFMFNSRFGKLLAEEIPEYLKESVKGNRIEPLTLSTGFDKELVKKEAERCLHCDCREIDSCRLRIYSDQYHANQKRFTSPERKRITKNNQHGKVIYEPAKCIKCGICVDITSEYSEELGLTYIGRGFDIEIGIPFSDNLEKGLQKVAEKLANACPTGSISLKEKL